ncbi:MAG TPA: hypothetical protein VNL97_02145 [Solirubrobacterales bacterium]|nr:hypothetical protein [Solirubrobacterales bacterium]
MNVFLSLIAILIAVLSWICLFKVIPDSLLAMFRFRLRRERDELAVEVLSGFYSNPGPAEEVIRDVETFMEIAPQLSPLHILLMRFAEIGTNVRDEHPLPLLDDLAPHEREQLEKRMMRISDRVGDHVLLETPSGWITLILGLPVAIAVVLFKEFRQRNGRNRFLATLIGGLRRRFSEGAGELACREHLV